MAGGYVLCEWNQVQKDYPAFQATFAALENEIIRETNLAWAPRTCGFMLPSSNEYGRTTILPSAFRGWGMAYAVVPVAGTNFLPHWRQTLTGVANTVLGNQTLIMGERSGDLIPEDIKIAWIGLAFPNKQQHITEVRWQIGDRKFGRINIEEMRGYNQPAIIFEDGYILDEEAGFHLYGYIEGPLPEPAWESTTTTDPHIYQSIVMLGAMYYKNINKVLGNPGTVIP